MTLTFTESDWNELWEASVPTQSTEIGLDEFETLERLPKALGVGVARTFNLAPGMWLRLADVEFQQDCIAERTAHDHPIQIMVLLAGIGDTGGLHPTLGGSRSYFSGSGISPGYLECNYARQRLTSVDVELEPELLESTFGEIHPSVKSLLFKGEDWKTSFYPTVTPAMRSLAQQIWNAPYRGAARQMYLYAKAWELLAMQIDAVTADQATVERVATLRPDTIDRLHHAKEILTQQVEHPPLLSEVARLVGISDRTLRRGFQELFGVSPLGYLTQLRMLRARQLLQTGEWTVAQVARTVGYGSLGHFGAAFKRQFGISPGACLNEPRSMRMAR
ncbi:MAG: helix-turn-helix transcriptional regulator [Leptolyngbyaceae cyanobacterium SU_3_3]|nr:helix-turn-helix transcriptional regulator [Leptolyngbyaceae cyanobacterium SU_3_3]NJR51949.1 helix-turn-helix transcriptional regulator [Leptolyngbyaceae cyanobacterium CSU_1_3]